MCGGIHIMICFGVGEYMANSSICYLHCLSNDRINEIDQIWCYIIGCNKIKIIHFITPLPPINTLFTHMYISRHILVLLPKNLPRAYDQFIVCNTVAL